MSSITLAVDTGSSFAKQEDRERAVVAAKAVLARFEWRAGQPEEIDANEAFAAYTRHVSDEEYLRSPRDTVLIAAWEAAESAANRALTEGWHDPNGAYCTIQAV